MNHRIVVVGSINMDLVIRTPRMPLPGETLRGSDFHVIPGGKGANQAVAAARQGGNVTLIGRVGDDDFGRAQQNGLRQEHIDLSSLTVDPHAPTGIAMIMLDEAGQNSIIISPGANGAVTAQHIDAASDAIKQADMLVCQLEIPMDAVIRAIELAHANHVPVLLNPAPVCQIDPALFEYITYLIPNEIEAEALTDIPVKDIDSAQAAAEQLQQSGAKTVMITLGGRGVFVAHDGEFYHEEIVPVKVVDTTAAGDAFVGSFAVAMTEGKSVMDAVRFAKHTAALAVTKLGAQSSLPTRCEVEEFLKRR